MPDKEKNSGQAIDWKTATVVLALVGGTYLTTSTLRSSRPTARESLERTSIGDQVVPARLWQDPFEVAKAYWQQHQQGKDSDSQSRTNAPSPERNDQSNDIKELAGQIVRHATHGAGEQGLTILEVMLSGGPYPEDAERRHRSRYAVLSALSTAGYIPSDADHIGYSEIPWPRGRDLETASSNLIPWLTMLAIPKNSILLLPYEWFGPNSLRGDNSTQDVLVLWLNSDEFEDHPAKRLAELNSWLATEVTFQAALPEKQSIQSKINFKLVDPSLYHLLNEDFGTNKDLQDYYIQLTNAFAGLKAYSSWSTTADALLVTNANGCRGEDIRNALAAKGWPTNFVNVTCTDDQLVEELIDELALRGTDLSNGDDAIALVSEWDTFYGRALPLTFAAAVKFRMNDIFTTDHFLTTFPVINTNYPNRETAAWLQQQIDAALPNHDLSVLATVLNRIITNKQPAMPGMTPAWTNLSAGKLIHEKRRVLEEAFEGITTNRFSDAVECLKTIPSGWPSNIYHFTYLRGVDGEVPGENPSQGTTGKEGDKTRQDNAGKADSPRPEGHSQMDYMPRLAATISRAETEYERNSERKFKAIGILGSDVYDKLLVLQSLRRHFTDEIFFTTDLDARLLHPRELAWTRNVIVASSFGFQLDANLQKEIPPFRDTYQTGQYLACLAALDYPAALTNLTSSTALAALSPRRYEIGRNGAYDLSQDYPPIYPQRLRPSSWLGVIKELPNMKLLALALTIALLVIYLSPMGRKGFRYLAAASLPAGMLKPDSPGVTDKKARLELAPSPGPGVLSIEVAAATGQATLPNAEAPTIVSTSLEETPSLPPLAAGGTGTLGVRLSPSAAEPSIATPGSPASISPPEPFEKWWAFRLTVWGLVVSVLGLVLLVSWIVVVDYCNGQGKPILLTEGISLWPTELIRFLSAGLALFFIFKCRFDLRQNKRELATDYTLPGVMNGKDVKAEWEKKGLPLYKYIPWIDPQKTANWPISKSLGNPPEESVSGEEIYKTYNLLGYWWHRVYRIIPPILLYIFFSCIVFTFFEKPFIPFRGNWSRKWDLVAMSSCGILQIVLIFFVVDASCLCRKFIKHLTHARVRWPSDKSEKGKDLAKSGFDPRAEFTTISIIASRTEAVGKLVFYPFIILFLTIISRSTFFDRWDWPPSLILIYGLNAALAVAAVWQVRNAAENARKSALSRLDETLLQALARKGRGSKGDNVEQIKTLISNVQSIETGAFAPVTRQPFIRALLMPFGGLGLLNLIEYLASRQ